MEWLLAIAPDGRKIYYEAFDIKTIQLIQPVNILTDNEPGYLVVIIYNDERKEKAILPHYSWELWNSYKGVNNEDK